ncbi:hypothetical protein TNCV_4045351 [Trichonephila clavipes]|nr:hypothetical protein TNCV_4045351 [Trichonephila clavipes]
MSGGLDVHQIGPLRSTDCQEKFYPKRFEHLCLCLWWPRVEWSWSRTRAGRVVISSLGVTELSSCKVANGR